jgi:ketosteroid isomerase-like protein
MATAANKATAQAIVQDAIVSRRIDRAAFTEDATWQLVGTLDLPIDAYIEEMDRGAGTQFSGRGRIDIQRVIAEADSVVVEAKVSLTLKDTREYTNTYCSIISFRGDKVRQVKCYYDTAHAHRFFQWRA